MLGVLQAGTRARGSLKGYSKQWKHNLGQKYFENEDNEPEKNNGKKKYITYLVVTGGRQKNV